MKVLITNLHRTAISRVRIPTTARQSDNEVRLVVSKFRTLIKFLCLPKFQSHHALHFILLCVNYIQLQRRSNKFHGLTIKTKSFLGLKLGQIQLHIIMTCAWRCALIPEYFIGHEENIVQQIIFSDENFFRHFLIETFWIIFLVRNRAKGFLTR